MYNTVTKRGAYVWVHDANQHYVCLHNGEVVASIFRDHESAPYEVVIMNANFEMKLKGEREQFMDPHKAMARAEEVVVDFH